MTDNIKILYTDQQAEEMHKRLMRDCEIEKNDVEKIVTTLLIKNIEIRVGIKPSKLKIEPDFNFLHKILITIANIESRDGIINDETLTEKFGETIHHELKTIVSDKNTLSNGRMHDYVFEKIGTIEEIAQDKRILNNVRGEALGHFLKSTSKLQRKLENNEAFAKFIESATEKAETNFQEMESNAWRMAYVLQTIRFNEYIKSEGKEPDNAGMLIDAMSDDEIAGLQETFDYMKEIDLNLFVYRSLIQIFASALNSPHITQKLKRYTSYNMSSIILLSQVIKDVKSILNDDLNAKRFSFLDDIQHFYNDTQLDKKHLEYYADILKTYMYDDTKDVIEINEQLYTLELQLKQEYSEGVDPIEE